MSRRPVFPAPPAIAAPPVARVRMAAIGSFLALLLFPKCAAAEPVLLRPQYRLQATVDPGTPHIEGDVEVAFTNSSAQTLAEAVFLLFPNRFALPDEGIDDFTRPYVYPEEEFAPGGLELVDVRDAGVPASAIAEPRAGVPPGTIVRVPIAPLRSGETRRLALRFRTTVPHRFGTFGEFAGQLTLVGGWYPYLAALGADGEWQVDGPPPLADFDVALSAAPGLEMVLNGRYIPHGAPPARLVVPSVHYLSLVAAPRLLRSDMTAGDTRIVFFRHPPRLAMRVSPEPSQTQILLDAVRAIVAERPAGVPPPPAELVLVEAPMRLDLAAAGEGAVVISDRMLKLHALLRPFHTLQLAEAVYAELLRPQLAAREPAADYWWVSEGVSHLMGERYLDRSNPQRRSVYDWIELFNIFAVVDRFESVPRIPFVDAFFHRVREADPLHEQITTFNRAGPPGRVVISKLRALIGPPRFDPLLDRCLQTTAALRDCVAAEAGEYDVAARLSEWVGPYPAINYRFERTRFNEPEAGRYRTTVRVRRDSGRPYAEPVTVRLRTLGGADVDLQWKSGGDVAIMSAATPGRVYQAVIDPDRQLIDDRRRDNARPPTPQIVLDSADVEVSSTEFNVAALVVGRLRYDYRKDIALAGFYTNRGIGFTVGGRLHWGTPIDATRYRHNLYGFYVFESLDSDFKNKSNRTRRTCGQLGGIGLRYDYSNVFWGDNPSGQRALRLYADWYDKNLGSDFGYLRWGYVLSGTLPLGTHRTIGALQVLNGFSEAFNSLVPNQGLYSLGGARSIRGIGAEEELARNIFMLRTEVRQSIFPELDLNLLDLLVWRRTQLHLFVDTGRVSNSAGSIYDVGRFAAGVGAGLAVMYDFMGFFPATAYLEVATRVDDPDQAGDVQVLFGTNQAF